VTLIYLMFLTGFVRCLSGCPISETAHLPLEATATVSLFLILRAFSSGATALTGVEAVADGVQAFRRPQSENAASTLSMMLFMTVTMFMGITILSVLLHIRVTEEIAVSRSVLSQIGETIFGRTLPYFLLQGLTAGILILAANTSYQDFPRLSAILARDRFMPSQFKNRGDRLVFSNGIVILAILACLLIYAFDAELTRLIQLYVVGVFTAFTLSQSGMVRRWWRLREPGWRRSMTLNAIGAAATGVVLVIVTVTKFTHGAWIVLAAMPIIITFFLTVHRHYARIGRTLRAETEPPPAGRGEPLRVAGPRPRACDGQGLGVPPRAPTRAGGGLLHGGSGVVRVGRGTVARVRPTDGLAPAAPDGRGAANEGAPGPSAFPPSTDPRVRHGRAP
jgi:amino acid transporter